VLVGISPVAPRLGLSRRVRALPPAQPETDTTADGRLPPTHPEAAPFQPVGGSSRTALGKTLPSWPAGYVYACRRPCPKSSVALCRPRGCRHRCGASTREQSSLHLSLAIHLSSAAAIGAALTPTRSAQSDKFTPRQQHTRSHQNKLHRQQLEPLNPENPPACLSSLPATAARGRGGDLSWNGRARLSCFG
jgi:hypothetical protein